MKSITTAAHSAAGTKRPRRRFVVLLAGVATAVAVFSATSTPAFSAGSGAVNATVTATAACITLDKTSLEFGSAPFSTGNNDVAVPNLDLEVTATNCGSAAESFYVRGTDATNSGASVTWTLTDVANPNCTLGINKFKLSLNIVGNGSFGIWLSKADQQLGTSPVAGNSSITTRTKMRMPCTGSGGAGEAMSWQYIYTATL